MKLMKTALLGTAMAVTGTLALADGHGCGVGVKPDCRSPDTERGWYDRQPSRVHNSDCC